MTFECKVCGSNMEPNARFCVCGTSEDVAARLECGTRPEKNELVCNRCRIKLSSSENIYNLSESSGCLVYYLEYCKECYKAELIERATQNKIYKEEEKAARARCKKCEKPFPGIFRKKRYQANSLGDLTRDYYCKDCFLALPKNEKLDEPRDVSDPWPW
jgi:hypothetical protein